MIVGGIACGAGVAFAGVSFGATALGGCAAGAATAAGGVGLLAGGVWMTADGISRVANNAGKMNAEAEEGTSASAAESPTPLEQGAAKVPSAWGDGIPNTKGVGTRWFDPAAPKANGIRIDEGIPGSSWPSQQVDHVVVRSGGRILGPDGKPIVGSLKDNPQAHIPLSDWLNWTSWNAP